MSEYTNKVKRLLAQYHGFKARQYTGDYDAVDVLIDLHAAIEQAGLTAKQREALEAVYFDGHTQKAVAKALGISEKAVSLRLAYAVVKIAAVYESWNYLDEVRGVGD